MCMMMIFTYIHALPVNHLILTVEVLFADLLYDDDDVYLKKITTRVSQNLILHKNADQPKA
jgi:hypothetical protein